MTNSRSIDANHAMKHSFLRHAAMWPTLLASALLAAALPAAAAVVEEQSLGPADFTVDTPRNVPDARFGDSVAVAGNWMAVGAPGDNGGSGRVAIYERVSGDWVLRNQLVAPVAQIGSRFGAAVDVYESGGLLTVIVGAPMFDAAETDQGRAYVYSDTNPGAAFSFTVTTVNPTTAEANGLFGAAVALFADRAAIASPNAGTTEAGQVTIRGRNTGGTNAWGQAAAGKAGNAGNHFGTSIDLHGEYLIVGAPHAGTPTRTGLVYVYGQNQGGADAWGLKHTLTPASAQADMAFGTAVAIWDADVAAANSASRSMVGAPLTDNGGVADVGSVQFFLDGTVNHSHVHAAAAVNAHAHLGYSVALEGGEAIAGRPDQSQTNFVLSGRVDTFSFDGTGWGANSTNINQFPLSAGNGFGYAVDVSGVLAVASAPRTSVPAGTVHAGVVRPLIKQGPNWTSEAQFGAVFEQPNLAVNQSMGYSTALTDEWMAVGVTGDGQKGANAGAVYMYRSVSGVWTPHSKLTALYGAAGDSFGQAVTLDGNRLVVGAPSFDGFPASTSNAGAIYLFEYDGTHWVQRLERASPNPSTDGYFGYSVALRGDVLVAGAYRENGLVGRVYAFRSLADLSDPLTLNSPGLSMHGATGWSVSVYDPAPGTPNDEVIAVGAPAATSTQGAAYVLSGPTFSTVTMLTDPALASGRFFGHAVSIFNGRVAVGAPTMGSAPSGGVVVFSGSGYATATTLVRSTGAGQFGYSLGLDDTSLLIGAPASNTNTGRAILFRRSGSSWTESGLLQPAVLATNDAAGSAVAMSGGQFVMGAPSHDPDGVANAGAAFVYSRAPEVSVSTTSLDVAESGLTDSVVVSLSAAPDSDVTLALSFDGQMQVDAGNGYGASPQTVTLTPANAVAGVTVQVRAVDDVIDEPSPHVSLITAGPTVSSSSRFDGLAVPAIDVNITDNDMAGIDIIQAGPLVADEGTSGTSYSVVLDTQPIADVTVDIAFDPAQLIVGGESDGMHSLVFTPGNWNLARAVFVVAVDDTVVEGPHSTMITQTVSSSDPAYAAIDPPDLPVSIADNDIVELIFSSAGFSAFEGASFSPGVTLRVVSNGVPGGTISSAVSADMILTLGTATDPSDVVVTQASTLFPAGTPHNSTANTATVGITDDRLLEQAETFTLALQITSGLATTTAVNDYTIIDNETATLAFPSSSSSVEESVGTANVPMLLTISGPGTGPLALGTPVGIEIPLADGSAQAPDDYTAASTTLNFASGTETGATQDATFTVGDDRLVEGDETLTATLGTVTTLASGVTTTGSAHVATITDNDTAELVFQSATSTATEAMPTHSVDVVLGIDAIGSGTIALADAASVAITTTPVDATTPGDYTLTTSSIAWPAGAGDDTVVSVDLTIVDDAIAEDGETFALGFGAVTGQITATGTHTVTIDDNDAPGVTIIESDSNTQVSEGGAGDGITVQLDSAPTSDVAVLLAFDPMQIVVGGELMATHHPVVFTSANWNVPQSVDVIARDDATVEASPHTSLIAVSTVSDDPVYAALDPADINVGIVENDTAVITLAGAASDVDETTSPHLLEARLDINANGAPGGTLADAASADVVLAAGSAELSSDYAADTAGITFAAGAAHGDTQPIAVTIVNDRLLEGPETLVVSLAPGTGDATVAGSHTVTIVDDERATIDFTDDTAVLPEDAGNSIRPVWLTITGSGDGVYALADDVAVAVTHAAGSAATPDDFTVATTSLIFAAGSTSGVQRDIAVAAVDDRLVEGDETFTLALGPWTGIGDITADGTQIVSILDNDLARIGFVGGNDTISEAVGTYTKDVELIVTAFGSGPAALSQAVSLPLQFVAGTATTPADVTLLTTSVELPAGAADGLRLPVEVTIVDDAMAESDETFELHFVPPVSPGVVFAPQTTTVTIDDNDSPGITVLESGGDTAVTEGGASDTYTLTLDSEPTADVNVTLTFPPQIEVSQGATFVASPVTLVFTPANWNIIRSLGVQAVDDAIVEGPLEVTIEHAAASTDPDYDGRVLAPLNVAVADDDSAVIGFSPTTAGAAESAGTMQFTVTLSQPAASGVTVSVDSIDGTAGSADFTPIAGGVVTFAPGSTVAQTVAVTLLDDAVPEDDETFTLVLGHPVATGDVSLGAATATGTILDDEGVSTLAINAPVQPEGTGSTSVVEFVVTVTPPSGQAISFTRATADGSATVADGDYIALPPQTITIPAGEGSIVIPVTVAGDAVAEADETLRLLIGDVSNAIPGSLVGTATLLDDDANPTITTIIDVSPDPARLDEPYTVQVRVSGTSTSPLGTITVDDGDGGSCGPVDLVPQTPPDSIASCELTSTSAGTKTLTATFVPTDGNSSSSAATASLQIDGGTVIAVEPAVIPVDDPRALLLLIVLALLTAGIGLRRTR